MGYNPETICLVEKGINLSSPLNRSLLRELLHEGIMGSSGMPKKVPVLISCISSAAVVKYHTLDGLKEQKVILSQFCRPEVQNQGISRALGENASLSIPSFW